MIEVKNLRYRYPGQEHSIIFPDFSIQESRELLILGKSGSGKSTLLNLISSFLPLQEGEIHIQDRSLSAMSEYERLRWRSKQMGFVLQRPVFIRSMNLWDNLRLAAFAASVPFDDDLATAMLKRFNLTAYRYQSAENLSVGERQRFMMIRSVIHKPVILLADEPSASLDDSHCTELIDVLKELSENQNVFLLIVTHDQRIKERFKNRIEL